MLELGLRGTIAIVALLNLAYFGVEFTVAMAIGSVALFADSIDFLEDASVNLLILLALGWSAAKRKLVGVVLAGLLLVPGFAALWTIADKLLSPAGSVPDPTALTLAGVGALLVNSTAAYLLARVRHHGGSLTLAAFLSARNDVFANIGIIGAGLATAATHSIWPDVIVGLAIALINIGAAKEVYEAAVEGDGDGDSNGNTGAAP